MGVVFEKGEVRKRSPVGSEIAIPEVLITIAPARFLSLILVLILVAILFFLDLVVSVIVLVLVLVKLFGLSENIT
jgi:hypothetical protein